jgi:aldose sugar dehydrogenase
MHTPRFPLRPASTLSLLAPLIAALCSSGMTQYSQASEHPRDQTTLAANIGIREPSQAKPLILLSGLDHPWAMAFMDNHHILITERAGQLRVATANSSGEFQLSEPVAGVPEVFNHGQGGLLDVAWHNHRVYFSYSEPGRLMTNSTAVMSAELAETTPGRYQLQNQQVIFSQQPKKLSTAHFGSRLVFAPDDTLFITLGERYIARDDAQTLDNDLGKLVRINADGSIPADNPFVATPGALPEIWSYGHRNMQGAAINPQTGKLWTHEHGPKGGDEINIPEAGKNYGWPLATWGKEYTGGDIGEGPHKAGTEPPLYYWLPSIAPSGMAFYTGNAYPGWENSLFVGSLKFRQLVRLSLDGETITAEERLFQQGIGERIRDVRQGPDGLLYLLTDEDNGKLIRLMPVTP